MDYLQLAKDYIKSNQIIDIPIKKPKIKVNLSKTKPLNEIEPNETRVKTEEIQLEIEPDKELIDVNPIDKISQIEFLSQAICPSISFGNELEEEQIGLIIIEEINYEKINELMKNSEDKLITNNLISIKILVKNKEKEIPTFPIESKTIESWGKTIKNLIENEIKIPKKNISKIIPFKTIGKQYNYVVIVKQHKKSFGIPSSLYWYHGNPKGIEYHWDVRNIIYKHSDYRFEEGDSIETIQVLYSYISEIEKDRQWINRNYSIGKSHNIIGLSEIFETIAISV